MTDHPRLDLDEALNDGRRPIDADWSPRKKAAVAVLATLIAGGAIGGGMWAYLNSRTPSLPRNFQQAMRTIESGKLDRMDPQRRAQYAAEAGRLLWSLSDEERRKLFEDEKARESLRGLWEQRMDDMAYRIARGDEIDWSEFGPPRGEMSEEQRKRMQEMRERWEKMTPEEREKEMARRQEEMRTQMANRMREQFSSGNSQSGALRGEMFSRGRGAGGGGGGPGGGPRGGGPRGPRGPGGPGGGGGGGRGG